MSKASPVIIIAPPGDAHALVVAERIEARNQEVIIWDSSRLPSQDTLNLQLASEGDLSIILESTACGTLNLSQVQSIWWRRPRAATIPGAVVDGYIRGYCRSETDQFLRGVLAGLKIPVYNNPDNEEKSSRKAYQLRIASETGFSIPQTLITCSPDNALEFCQSLNEGVIFKPFRAPAGSHCATQEFNPQLSHNLQLLRNSPTIFQEKISPYKDVRVSVVGHKLFAGISNSQFLDWRVDGNLTWAGHKLPFEAVRSYLFFYEKTRLDLRSF
ncbi:MAG: hypothetical protein WKG06_44410 [Segetibacter sp.]